MMLCDEFIEELGSAKPLGKAVIWYERNIDKKWTPTCLSFSVFLEKFHSIEAAMRRTGDLAEGGDDEADDDSSHRVDEEKLKMIDKGRTAKRRR